MIRFVEAALFVYALWVALIVGLHVAKLTKSTFSAVAVQMEAASNPRH